MSNIPMKRKRTLSSSNLSAAEKIYDYKLQQHKSQYDKLPKYNREVIKSTMILPTQYNAYALNLCVDDVSLENLERSRSINWHENVRNLLPLYTKHDGNTCLNSISIYIYGVQDSDLSFRNLVYQRLFMEKAADGSLYSRWAINRRKELDRLQRYDRDGHRMQSMVEWKDVISQCSTKQYRNSQGTEQYVELSSIHIFVIANVLGRAIIVLSDHTCNDTDTDSVKAAELNGIYLPLLRNSLEVETSPIVLGYTHDIFTPLLSSENLELPLCKNKPLPSAGHCLPLVRHDLSRLPVKFLLPDEEQNATKYLELFLEYADMPSKSGKLLPSVWFKFKPPPAWCIELLWSFHQMAQAELLNQHVVEEPFYARLKFCARREVKKCPNYAAENKDNLCLSCYDEYMKEKSRIPKRPSLNKKPSNVELNEHYNTPNSSYVKQCKNTGCNGIAYPEYEDICRECFVKLSGAKPRTSPVHYYETVNGSRDRQRGNFDVHAPSASRSMEPVARSHSPISQATASPSWNLRKKLICELAGCDKSPINESTYCSEHTKSKARAPCIMPECNQMAEQSDLGVCMFCYQRNKHLEDENDYRKRDTGRTFGRGAVEIQQDLSELSLTTGSMPPSLQPQPQISIPFESIPPLPPLPQSNTFAPTENMNTTFMAPQVYEGYSGVNTANFGSQQGVMNWQKERVSANSSPRHSMSEQCQYCQNNALPGRRFCDRCFEVKSKQNSNPPDVQLKKCINGCRAPGIPDYAYLCETCYQKQLQDMKPVQQPEPMRQAPQPVKPMQPYIVGDPCKTKGCVNLTMPPSKVCEQCKERFSKGAMGYEYEPPQAEPPVIMHQPGGNLVQCKGLGCDFFGSPEFNGYCSTCFMETTKQEAAKNVKQSGIRTYAPPSIDYPPAPPQPMYHSYGGDHYSPYVGSQSTPCRTQGCEMFGNLQFDGYCSVCYKRLTNRVERDTVFT